MKQKLRSLRARMVLPVICIAAFIVMLMNIVFSTSFIKMTLRQEQLGNASGFSTITNTLAPILNKTVDEVRGVISDERVAVYARHRYGTGKELIHARISCRNALRSGIVSHERVYGLLFMRENESLFGVLPEANLFLDDPKKNPLPEEVRKQILNIPLGQTIWLGPLSVASISGIEDKNTSKSVMIGAWKSVSASYGECYVMMLIDESILHDLFQVLNDGKSTWYIFGEDGADILHLGEEENTDLDQLIRESNSGEIFRDEDGTPFFAFSMEMKSPAWTVIRQVSVEESEKVRNVVRAVSAIFGAIILLVTLIAYMLWLKKFMRQYNSLQNGIIRIGEGDLESTTFVPTSINEFEQMQMEINKTRLALINQIETIREMERDQMEQENKKKEQERISQELVLAKEIQASAMPQIFSEPPGQIGFNLFASMTPAKEVGGDFYDFFKLDEDHLALVIADVSGKGIPAALFMMVSKTLIRSEVMTGCDPATALQRVNLQLCEHNVSKMFVTVWLAIIDLSTGKGISANAGHEHPCLRRADGTFELDRYPHDLVLGIIEIAKFRNHPIELNPGDCVFVYTDGVPEAEKTDRDMFGLDRLLETLNQNPDASPEELIQRVHGAVDEFAGDAEQFDDITMLCLEYLGRNQEDGRQVPES